jgi:hypothetical protein
MFVHEAARDWEFDAVRDGAVLVASELVGNAVAHTRTSCLLDLRIDRLGVTVAVRDYDYRGLLVPWRAARAAAASTDNCSWSLPSAERGVSARQRTARACGLLPFSAR